MQGHVARGADVRGRRERGRVRCGNGGVGVGQGARCARNRVDRNVDHRAGAAAFGVVRCRARPGPLRHGGRGCGQRSVGHGIGEQSDLDHGARRVDHNVLRAGKGCGRARRGERDVGRHCRGGRAPLSGGPSRGRDRALWADLQGPRPRICKVVGAVAVAHHVRKHERGRIVSGRVPGDPCRRAGRGGRGGEGRPGRGIAAGLGAGRRRCVEHKVHAAVDRYGHGKGHVDI